MMMKWCIYDLFLDLPHPDSSLSGGGGGGDAPARIIDPPMIVSPALHAEMLTPENLARLTRLAYPDHDDRWSSGETTATTAATAAAAVLAAKMGKKCNIADQHQQQQQQLRGNSSSHEGGRLRYNYNSNLNKATAKATKATSSSSHTTTTTTNNHHHHLTSRDIYHNDYYTTSTTQHHHTFSVLLADNKTRVHGHVRRYLPSHTDSQTRLDVGRRSSRVMILLTRAQSGWGMEQFYNSVLKTIECLLLMDKSVQSSSSATAVNQQQQQQQQHRRKGVVLIIDPVRKFLHELYNKHMTLILQYGQLQEIGLGLNFTSITGNSNNNSRSSNSNSNNLSHRRLNNPIPTTTFESASDVARWVMKENEDLFCITLDNIELGLVSSSSSSFDKGGGVGRNNNNTATKTTTTKLLLGGMKDTLQFHLPIPLQPGYISSLSSSKLPIIENSASSIMPLLRYIGSSHFVRLVSALLCECRIILISASITRLSSCVHAASAILAQGMLAWKHVLIPVLPPQMIQYLGGDTGGGNDAPPFLVGILTQYTNRLSKLSGLVDVLCVNVDKNEIKTLNMKDPRMTVPDMLSKRGMRGSGSSSSSSSSSKRDNIDPYAAEILAGDLDEIMRADQILWGQRGNNSSGSGNVHNMSRTSGSFRNSSINSSSINSSMLEISSDNSSSDIIGRRSSSSNRAMTFLERMKNPTTLLSGMKDTMNNTVSKSKQHNMSLEEKRQYATSVDAAVAFGRMIRSNFKAGLEDGSERTISALEDKNISSVPRYAKPVHDINIGTIEACTVSENEGGDEDLRAALTCFFIYMFGDMGMYLSKTRGTFWLDRRKYLLRRKQLGENENSPTFVVIQKFSASSMFACHVKGRIDDLSLTARDRLNIMPHHLPLFDICSKYLAIHRLDFSLLNVRRIVAKTVLSCVRHMAVESHIATRTMALALTAETPYVGDVTLALSGLLSSCRECNTHLCVVMSVIWYRLNQSSKSTMSVIMTLNLLKTLILEGPLTAITEALDGTGKLYELKGYSESKNADANREVRLAANHVYSMLIDLPSIFVRRRRIAITKVHQAIGIDAEQSVQTSSNYLVSRLPLTTEAWKLHALFRPYGIAPTYYDDNASVAPSIDASTTTLGLARRRLATNDNSMYLHDEVSESKCYDDNTQARAILPVEQWNCSESVKEDNGETEDIFLSELLPLSTMSNALTSNDIDTSRLLEQFNDVVSLDSNSCLSVSIAGM